MKHVFSVPPSERVAERYATIVAILMIVLLWAFDLLVLLYIFTLFFAIGAVVVGMGKLIPSRHYELTGSTLLIRYSPFRQIFVRWEELISIRLSTFGPAWLFPKPTLMLEYWNNKRKRVTGFTINMDDAETLLLSIKTYRPDLPLDHILREMGANTPARAQSTSQK